MRRPSPAFALVVGILIAVLVLALFLAKHPQDNDGPTPRGASGAVYGP